MKKACILQIVCYNELNKSRQQPKRYKKMKLFNVAIKQDNNVVYAGVEEAVNANEAINKAAKWAQLPFNNSAAYDAYDENAEAILKKIIMPEPGQFRLTV